MLLDTAISEAMLKRKPVYIEVACEWGMQGTVLHSLHWH